MDQANQNDWPKENQKKCPIKVIQTATRGPLIDSLSLSLPESINTNCIFVPSLILSLFSVFVGILFCKAKGSGPLSLTTGLVARIWYYRNLWLGTEALLQAVAGQGH